MIEQVDGDLAGIVQLLETNEDLRRLWFHPVVAAADKQAMARQIFGGKVHPLVLNVASLMFDKKRGNIFPEMQKAFRDRFNATRRRATVKVTSALPLDEASAQSLRQLLASRLEKEITMETEVDPGLMGGMILQIEDQVIDNSLKGRLESLRHSLV